MPASVGYLVIDTANPSLLVPFWCGLLGVEVDTTIGEGQFVLLTPPRTALRWASSASPTRRPGRTGLHLDLIVEDLAMATAEVQALGGRWLEPDHTRELEDFQWRQMADPEGNEFDLDVLPPG
jgi:hypothetical protein